MLLILLVAATCGVVGATDEADEELSRPERVINGLNVAPGVAQWQVSVQLKYSGTHFCGGALIDPEWVLTAAHCTFEQPAENIRVALGSNIFKSLDVFYNVEKIVRHPYYSKTTLANDIALLKITNRKKTVPREMGAEMIKMEHDENFVSPNCYVTGFGRLKVGGPRATVMQQAQVALYTYDQCRSAFLSSYYIGHGHVCAGGGTKDACQGDSGGPLSCCTGDLSTSKSCKLVGITSWGIGCGNVGTPGVYTKVSYYTDWIKGTMENKDYKDKEFKDKGGWNFFKQMINFISPILPFMDKEAIEEAQKKETEIKDHKF